MEFKFTHISKYDFEYEFYYLNLYYIEFKLIKLIKKIIKICTSFLREL